MNSTPAQNTADAVIEEIEETTVGMLNGHRVPMGSMIRNADYTLADGTKKQGLVGSLIVAGKTGVFVGMGSTIQVGEHTWEVVGIEKAPGQLGSMRLQQQ